MNKRLIASVTLVVVALSLAVVATVAAVASDEVARASLTKDELLSLDPIDPQVAIEQGWDATIKEIQERAVSWYEDQRVAEVTVEELAAALPILSDAISNPPTEEEPDQVMYIHEMIYRREAVCRSLPSSELRDEYCSATSAPELDIPWAEA